VELREFGPDDADAIGRFVDLEQARSAEQPWMHPVTPHRVEMEMRHGWDGEVGRYFLAHPSGAEEPVGRVVVNQSSYENLDTAWISLLIHPDHRRQGHGSALLEATHDLVRSVGRTKVSTYGWDNEATSGFAAAAGYEPKSRTVMRRQHLDELAPGLVDGLFAEAQAHADDYELVRIIGHSPAELLEPLAAATDAINDAPLDDLDLEDEVFSVDRIRAYENAQLESGFRFYRIVARHERTGEIGGLTVVTVDSTQPWIGDQHDTSVVRAHRGHRLGILLKADMLRWLAEAEPQLKTIDTFNAASNDHMVAINQRLGYRVLAEEIVFQRRL